MRILHTSDWHLGDKLGPRRLPRQPHLRKSLEQIAAYLEQYQVDVMVVSGDIFGDRLHQTERLDAIKDLKDVFAPFLINNGTIVMISGNHDNEILFETERTLFDLVAPAIGEKGDVRPNGRLYLSSEPAVLRLADRKHSEEIVQFVLMPYPTPRVYLKPNGIKSYSSPSEKHSRMQAEFMRILNQRKNKLDPEQQSVLVSHIFVRGTELNNRAFRLTEAEDVLFDRSDIPTEWAYAAYGHIHKPQAIFGEATSPHIRYAGSIEPMDFDERNDQKSVVYLEIRPGQNKQIVDGPYLLPLTTTPMYEVIINDPETELLNLRERYPDADRALVKYVLHWDATKHRLNVLRETVEQAFPNYYDWSHLRLGAAISPNNTYTLQHGLSVGDIVTSYLQEQLKDDADRAEILTLANKLLAEEN